MSDRYEELELEILMFEGEDVITSSPGCGDEDDELGFAPVINA